MLYRDAPTVQVEARIAADPEAIWEVLSDIAFPVGQSDELQSVRWLDGADGVAVGNRFEGTNRNEVLGEWTTQATIIDVDPGRRWVWQIRNGDDVMATWGFEVDPGRDAVTVRQWARLGPDPSGLSIAIAATPDKEARIVSHRMAQWRTGMQANLDALRGLVEAAS